MKLTGTSRLPESDRAEMRAMREAKPWLWSYEALAQHFGTTRWTAMNVCKADAAIVCYAAIAGEVRNG